MKQSGVKGSSGILLAARILLALLFLIFGWPKLLDYSGTMQFMAHIGLPLPAVAAVIAIIMEFFVSIAIIVGIATRPLAVLLAIYTLATAFIGHHFWTMTGMAHVENEINFFKNISIIGGLLTLYVTGAGCYSVDALLCRRSKSTAAT